MNEHHADWSLAGNNRGLNVFLLHLNKGRRASGPREADPKRQRNRKCQYGYPQILLHFRRQNAPRDAVNEQGCQDSAN